MAHKDERTNQHRINSLTRKCKEGIKEKQARFSLEEVKPGDTISFMISLDDNAMRLIEELRAQDFSYYFIMEKLKLVGYSLETSRDLMRVGAD